MSPKRFSPQRSATVDLHNQATPQIERRRERAQSLSSPEGFPSVVDGNPNPSTALGEEEKTTLAEQALPPVPSLPASKRGSGHGTADDSKTNKKRSIIKRQSSLRGSHGKTGKNRGSMTSTPKQKLAKSKSNLDLVEESPAETLDIETEAEALPELPVFMPSPQGKGAARVVISEGEGGDSPFLGGANNRTDLTDESPASNTQGHVKTSTPGLAKAINWRPSADAEAACPSDAAPATSDAQEPSFADVMDNANTESKTARFQGLDERAPPPVTPKTSLPTTRVSLPISPTKEKRSSGHPTGGGRRVSMMVAKSNSEKSAKHMLRRPSIATRASAGTIGTSKKKNSHSAAPDHRDSSGTRPSASEVPDIQSEPANNRRPSQEDDEHSEALQTSSSDSDGSEAADVMEDPPHLGSFADRLRPSLHLHGQASRLQHGSSSSFVASRIEKGRCSVLLSPALIERTSLSHSGIEPAPPTSPRANRKCAFRQTVVVFPVFNEPATKKESEVEQNVESDPKVCIESASQSEEESEEDAQSSSSLDTKSSTDSERDALIEENERLSRCHSMKRNLTVTDNNAIRPTTGNHEGIRLAGRRPVLIPGLELLPYIEHDAAFVSFHTIFHAEAHVLRRPQLRRARVHYCRMVERYPTNYVALVNLACCQAMCGQHAKALNLLKQAVKHFPGRAGAHINTVLCCMQLGNVEAAATAIERTFVEAQDLSKAQHVMLLRCKAAVLLRCQAAFACGDSATEHRAFELRRRAMNLCCEAAAEAGEEDPVERPPPETDDTRRSWINVPEDIAHYEYLEELRKGLGHLRAPAEYEYPRAIPWGRRHMYMDDDRACDNFSLDGASSLQGVVQKWCPLKPEELATLRTEMSKAPGHPGDQDQLLERGVNAYEAAQSLSFLRRLDKHQAVKLLNLAQMVEFDTDEYVFKQGDPADFMYVIASGAVKIEAVIPMYGKRPVILDTFYDGQSFGEKLAAGSDKDEGVPRRRASIVAQEPTVLLRFLPLDYRRVIGAAVEDNAMPWVNEKSRSRRTKVIASEIPEKLSAAQQAIKNRVKGLKAVPFIGEAVRAAASAQVIGKASLDEAEIEHQIMELIERHLFLFATNAQEIELRYGDEVVHIGQSPRGCFIIAEGFCKLTVPVNTEHDGDEDFLRSLKGDRASVWRMNDASRQSKFKRAEEQAADKAMSKIPELRQRPVSAGWHGTPRNGSTVIARKCGGNTPRQGRHGFSKVKPWAHALREGSPAPYKSTPSAKEIDLGWLYPGQAFGLGALWDSKGECPYTALLTVRVESCAARILVMTERSLWYLPDAVAHQVRVKSREVTDPCRPNPEIIHEEMDRRTQEAAERHRVLREMSNKAD